MEPFVLLFVAACPHLAEELWQPWGTQRRWPTSRGRAFDESLIARARSSAGAGQRQAARPRPGCRPRRQNRQSKLRPGAIAASPELLAGKTVVKVDRRPRAAGELRRRVAVGWHALASRRAWWIGETTPFAEAQGRATRSLRIRGQCHPTRITSYRSDSIGIEAGWPCGRGDRRRRCQSRWKRARRHGRMAPGKSSAAIEVANGAG